MKLEDIVTKETENGTFPELGVRIKMLDLIYLGKEYLSMFEEQMTKTDDETQQLIIQSKYNAIYEFFGKYIDENY